MEPGSSENLKKLLESDLVFQKPCGFANGFSLSLSLYVLGLGRTVGVSQVTVAFGLELGDHLRQENWEVNVAGGGGL
jgi:hypothetical protein